MHLTNEKFNELCDIAKKAALSAGELISKTQGSSLLVQSKEGGENLASQVVTEIDIEAQNIILRMLGPTLLKYDLGLLAEEDKDDGSRFTKDYFWCIDPLDGTLAFSRNEDGYSTSIALISKEGDPIIGVVYNPRTKSLYHAIKGLGAFKNEKPLKANSSNNKLTLLYDQSFLKHKNYQTHINHLKEKLESIKTTSLELFHLGGAVMNGITTIEMSPAIYFKFPKKADGGGSIWDFAASSIIQSEAGGHNSDFYKSKLDLNRSDSSFMNHKGIIYCSNKELLDIIPIE